MTINKILLSFIACGLVMQPIFVFAGICEGLLSLVENNTFKVNRDLTEYNSDFNGKLRPFLKKLLGSKKIWIDMGAGSAHAQIDYLYSAKTPATCIAVAYKFPHYLPLSRYKTLQAVEGMQTPESIRLLPQADLITDDMGILTYVDNPEDYLRAYIDRLLPGGKLMVSSYTNDIRYFFKKILESNEMVSNTQNTESFLIFTKL